MKTAQFKLNNGNTIPAAGYGVFLIPREKTADAVKTALDAGYRMIDTAACYNNERETGAGLRASGVSREKVFLTTKLWAGDFGKKRARDAFMESLARLGVDYVDMYMLHWPQPMIWQDTLDSWLAMIELQKEGKIKNLGVCNFNAENLQKLIDQSGFAPAVNQVELHPFFQQEDLQNEHKKLNILTQAWSPLGGVRGYVPKAQQTVTDIHTHPLLNEIGVRHGKTPAQIVLRWHLQKGISTNSRSANPNRIKENFNIFDFELTPEEMLVIANLDTGIRGGDDPQNVNADTYPATID